MRIEYVVNLEKLVSVPIWGLFNLTQYQTWEVTQIDLYVGFRPHLGII